MKKLIVLVAIFVIGISTFAQQLQTSSLYDLQGVFHNPAMAGTQKVDFAGISYRTQWSGISGSPQTMTAFASVNLEKQKLGIGGYLYGDKTGPTSRNGIQISLAKHIPLANGGKLSFGIENRIVQFGINKSKLTASLGNDPVLAGKENAMKYDAGVGVAYVDNKWALGVSASQLIQSKLDIYSGNLTRSEEGRLYRHFYAHGSYNWKVDEANVIVPNLLIIYLQNAPTEVQFGARVEHKDLLWFGLSARIKQAFMLSAGINASKNLSIGYSFDVYKSPLSLFDGGSSAHEVMISYKFRK